MRQKTRNNGMSSRVSFDLWASCHYFFRLLSSSDEQQWQCPAEQSICDARELAHSYFALWTVYKA